MTRKKGTPPSNVAHSVKVRLAVAVRWTMGRESPLDIVR